MGIVREIKDAAQFDEEVAASGTKLVVVDFSASWCGPCQRIAPFVEKMAHKYSAANFVKVDVDKCADVAATANIVAMPTFLLYRNGVKVDSLRGAYQIELEEKIRKYYYYVPSGPEYEEPIYRHESSSGRICGCCPICEYI